MALLTRHSRVNNQDQLTVGCSRFGASGGRRYFPPDTNVGFAIFIQEGVAPQSVAHIC